VFAPGAANVRSAGMVNLYTGKELQGAQRCHLTAAVFASDWERHAVKLVDSHQTVAALAKNDGLGPVTTYRKEGTPPKYPA
jgi:hypothetical protein